MNALERVADALTAEGGLLADAVTLTPPLDDALGRLAASGPAPVDAHAAAFAVEAVREGYLLHHGAAARVVRTRDADLGLLAGDRLYALGLAALAEAADVPAIAELADLIALCAQAHAAGDPDLAEALWIAAVGAVGHGTTPEHAAAKDAARRGDPSAASALRAASRHMAEQLALSDPD